ncbi:DUF4363 family protein [Sediminibacillus albus]|uniref:DUF4363 family protein n=1 Tax=Sediminibacillus albus TaxID=407036 RepID=A0A1G8X4A5_9BACI|nr:DUF4363 family protein [Sediminibacillus albus]SDJ85373.1 protein of unknown function [Sediminibacillus albus]
MKKFSLHAIPLLTLVFFIAIMHSGIVLKNPMGTEDRLYQSVNKLEENVKDKDWSSAKKEVRYIENAWKKVVRRIQFSVEREYLLEISGTISRIKGGIEAQDDQAVLEEIYYYYGQWHSLAT